jgi:PleD family two-component response regulator
MPVAVAGKELKVSAKAGVSTMLDGDTADSMLVRADEALSRAKLFKQQSGASV